MSNGFKSARKNTHQIEICNVYMYLYMYIHMHTHIYELTGNFQRKEHILRNYNKENLNTKAKITYIFSFIRLSNTKSINMKYGQ